MEYTLDDLPEALAARVRAATGEPDHLVIHRAAEWLVEALTRDRVTLMRLEVGDDDSIAETTDSFLLPMIEAVDSTADATVSFRGPDGRRFAPISEAFAAVLTRALAPPASN